MSQGRNLGQVTESTYSAATSDTKLKCPGGPFRPTTFGLLWPRVEAASSSSLETIHSRSIAQIGSIHLLLSVTHGPKMGGCKAAYTGIVNTPVYDDLRESSRFSSHGARTRALQTRSLFALAGRRVDWSGRSAEVVGCDATPKRRSISIMM